METHQKTPMAVMMTHGLVRFVCLIILLLLPPKIDGGTLTEYNSVHTAVLSGYNKDARPVTDQNNAMNVTLAFHLLTIANVDEVTSEVVSVGSFSIDWRDEVIQWNPFSYGGTFSINIDESLVWKPPMTFLNPMSTNVGLLGFKQSKIKYYADGNAYWNIADRYQTTCDFDTRYFPFDKQTCSMKIMVWDYNKNEVLMYPSQSVVDLTHYSENGAWVLASTETKFELLGENSVVVFNLNLERRPLFFVVNLFIPVFVMLMLNTLVFILPADSGERVGYSITCLLALAVFLSLVSDGLPQVSKPMPVIGYILATYLMISGLICVETIFILRVHHKEEEEEISPFFMRCYNLFSCGSCKKSSGSVDNLTTEKDLEMTKVAFEIPEISPITWKKISSRLDKICFMTSLASVIIVGAIFFVIVNVKSLS
ncbi:acetylcholine receptor subunit alpha-like [Saccostrea echinata]|uniref:acetylcholine receptor subunit alpha-like n=1 Tax=Saccostrea echinata TaxID=191078 RepID=UPI002A8030F6|nr:acetylcholine receptor subunit alpha-like [Saccostrea echinata]XP_061188905.1 acetylcholine receptor subunit alpha-like [Saccostrea echinata]